jgi:hypothetical protein
MCDCNEENIDNNGEPINSGGGGDLTSLENKTQNINESLTSPNLTTMIGNLTLNEPSFLSYGQKIVLDFGTFVNYLNSINTSDPTGKGRLSISASEVEFDCPVKSFETTFVNNDLVNKAYVDSVAGGIEVGTLATMLAKTGMTEGQQFFVNANLGTTFTSQENKLYYWSGRSWQVSGETIELLAKEDLLKGQVLQISGSGATADFQAEKTTITGDVDVIGIVANQDITAGEWFTVAVSGLWEVACIAGTYNRQNYLIANTNDGYASQSTSEADQPFAKILENRTISVVGGKVWALLNIIAEVY